MPNIGALLKEEITRLSRKQSRALVEPLKKQVAAHRADLATLKRELVVLRREIAAAANGARRAAVAAPAADDGRPRRFSSQGVQALRRRLELSAEDLGRLLGVSGQSIYNWEQGKVRPRAEQIRRIGELRAMGKRKARAALAEAAPAEGGRKSTASGKTGKPRKARKAKAADTSE